MYFQLLYTYNMLVFIDIVTNRPTNNYYYQVKNAL